MKASGRHTGACPGVSALPLDTVLLTPRGQPPGLHPHSRSGPTPQSLSPHVDARHGTAGSSCKGEGLQPVKCVAHELSRLACTSDSSGTFLLGLFSDELDLRALTKCVSEKAKFVKQVLP